MAYENLKALASQTSNQSSANLGTFVSQAAPLRRRQPAFRPPRRSSRTGPIRAGRGSAVWRSIRISSCTPRLSSGMHSVSGSRAAAACRDPHVCRPRARRLYPRGRVHRNIRPLRESPAAVRRHIAGSGSRWRRAVRCAPRSLPPRRRVSCRCSPVLRRRWTRRYLSRRFWRRCGRCRIRRGILRRQAWPTGAPNRRGFWRSRVWRR